ncbi:MAG: enolase C-terminal domain-like protein [Candidatus Parvarchaeota archaeon]
MKIRSVTIERVEDVEQPLYACVKPTDPYREMLGDVSPVEAAHINRIAFLRMTMDGDVSSIVPVSKQVAEAVVSLASLVVNIDVSDVAKTWDLLYRYSFQIERAGILLHAISAIDIMMYDSFAKSLNIPTYKLLGGKTRNKIRVYASHLHPLPKEQLEKEALGYVEEGYRSMKMRFISGPSDTYGVEKNLELLKIIWDAVGCDIELAADAWMSWNLNFAQNRLKRAERYELSWVEEPLLPDDFEGYRELCREARTRISAGEHHYHVYDFLRLIESGIRILQPDAVWVGGITPMKKIAALAESFGAVVIPNTSNIYNLHFIISEPLHLTPMTEYLAKYREWMEQHAINIPRPIKGFITLSEEPGFEIKYDFGK